MPHDEYTDGEGTAWAGMQTQRSDEHCDWCKELIKPGSYVWRASRKVMHNDCLTVAKETYDRQMAKDD